MIKDKLSRSAGEVDRRQKILLVLLPYWTPLIPPLGISCLKAYINDKGYRVKTVDTNIEEGFREIYNEYHEILSESIPEERSGNFYNIGHDVLNDHMMAGFKRRDESSYNEAVGMIIQRNFFVKVDDRCIGALNEIIDRFYSRLEEYFLRLLQCEQPDVLGLSVYDGTLPASLFCFKLAREHNPDIKTVMGGAIFSQNLDLNSAEFNRFLENTPYIDKIIVGEGEELFLKWLQGEWPESQRVLTRKDIGGTTQDIDAIPTPDFSDYDIRFYPYIAAYASRSCPYQCSFCAETVYWGRYRKKKVTKIIDHLDRLHGQYQSQLFLMCDSLLNPVITDLAGGLIEGDRLYYWDGYLRVDREVADMEKVWLWRRAGFYRARLGVESGSQQVLDSMDKKISPDLISSSIFNLARAGIKTTTYWIVGYPGETEADFRETLALIEELKDYIYEAECNPLKYFTSGQVDSAGFTASRPSTPLYPAIYEDLFLTQTWVLDGYPSREETYERINRFERHCRNLGIPNPYSLSGIYRADERWRRLHQQAVPPLTKFGRAGGVMIDECRKVEETSLVEGFTEEPGDFEF